MAQLKKCWIVRTPMDPEILFDDDAIPTDEDRIGQLMFECEDSDQPRNGTNGSRKGYVWLIPWRGVTSLS